MKALLLFFSLCLVSFQQPKKKTIDRIYFSQNASDILTTNPIDKKTKSNDVIKNFVEFAKSGSGSIILRGCANYDENDQSALIDKRLEVVKDELIKNGAPKESIITESFNKNLDLTAKPKKAIDTVKIETKREFLKAHNRFVEIKFLKRS